MCKTYDRIEWYFLEFMLLKLDFNGRWVELIMNWVSYVSYMLKENGGPCF